MKEREREREAQSGVCGGFVTPLQVLASGTLRAQRKSKNGTSQVSRGVAAPRDQCLAKHEQRVNNSLC